MGLVASAGGAWARASYLAQALHTPCNWSHRREHVSVAVMNNPTSSAAVSKGTQLYVASQNVVIHSVDNVSAGMLG